MVIRNRILRHLFLTSSLFFSLCVSSGTAWAGPLIQDLYPDMARYHPGDTAYLTVELHNDTGSNYAGTIYIEIDHLGDAVTNLSLTGISLAVGNYETNTLAWAVPTNDFHGYYILATASNAAGGVSDSDATAIDVSSDWNVFPRYGYVTDFGIGLDTEGKVDQMSRYHINALQYYDWHWEHHRPLNTNAVYQDVAGRNIYRATLTAWLDQAQLHNVLSFAYNDIGSAFDDYLTDGSGVTLDMGRFSGTPATLANHLQWGMPAGWNTTNLYLMNIRDEGWKNHIFGEMQSVLDEFPFDGWHQDALANDRTVYDYAGGVFQLNDYLAPYANEAATSLNTRIVQNCIDSAGENELAQSGTVDIVYTEMWTVNDDYYDFRRRVDNVRRFTDKAVVFAAYMNYGLSNGFFNEASVRLTDASIFASGGSHVEIGDGEEMLHYEYFPDNAVKMSDALKASLRDYYSFMTGYENLLRQHAVSDNYQVSITNTLTSTNGAAGSVWVIPRRTLGYQVAHFINFLNNTSTVWRDDAANYPVPPTQTDLDVKMYVEGNVDGGRLWYASPDFSNGAPAQLSYAGGSDGGGDFITFTLPRLEYWDMVWLEKAGTYDAVTTIEAEDYDSMAGLQAEACSDTGGGLNMGYVENVNGGSWVAFEDVDLGDGAGSFQIRAASAVPNGKIEIRLGAHDGQLLGVADVGATGGWQAWQTFTVPVSGAQGVQRIYLVFKDAALNLNWFRFTLLPEPWANTDVGGPTIPGAVDATNGTFYVRASGADIWGGADQFHYVYQSVTDDVEVITQVTQQEAVNAWAKAGLMLRNDLSGGSVHAAIFVTPANNVLFQWRDVQNGTSYGTGSGGSLSAPVWLKLTRTSGTVRGYYSEDGYTWTQVGAATNVPVSSAAYAGLAVTSHDNATNGLAVFEYPFVNHAPVASPWASESIGPGGVPGYGSYIAGGYRVAGAGADIESASDDFHLVSQAASGDAVVTVRVDSQDPTDPWAKAGLVFRTDDAPDAIRGAVSVTPSNGVVFQWRNEEGGFSGFAGGNSQTVPAWLRLERSSAGLRASYSGNGINWNQLGDIADTQTGPGGIFGLAVTSHDTGTLGIAEFSSFSVNTAPPPGPWLYQDIGAVSAAGQATYSSGVFNVTGSGGDIESTADEFQFVRQVRTGDVEIVAYLETQENTDPWAKSGVMIRDGLGAGALYGAVLATPANGIRFQWREAADGSSSSVGVGGIAAPVWLKLNCQAGRLRSSYSTNGTDWVAIGSTTNVLMSEERSIGLAVCSHNDGTLGTTEFSGVDIIQSEVPYPWMASGVGYMEEFSRAVYSDPVFAVGGSGGDIYGTQDGMMFVYQAVTSTVTLTARLDSQDPTDPWAKAGLMFRKNLAGGAANAAILQTAQNGVFYQWRDVEAGQTAGSGDLGLTNRPLWLKLESSSVATGGFYSLDGTNWVQMNSATNLLISPPFYAGMAVSAHDISTVGTALFSSVSIDLPDTPRQMTVVSEHGSPVPSVGAAWYDHGAAVTASVLDVTIGLTQYLVTGWTMTGQDPTSGTTNSLAMAITNDAVLTWLWTTNVVVPTNPPTAVIFGSSVAKGHNAGGAITNGSFTLGYAGRMTPYLESAGWTVTNNSVSGNNTTDANNRFDSDVVPLDPDIVLIGLSLANEGLISNPDKQAVYDSFRDGLTNLVTRCRTNGFLPVIGLVYPNNQYDTTTYAYVRSMNLLLNTWDVPSINFLGAVDEGDGTWAPGFWNDDWHPNNIGHEEMQLAWVPSLYEALAAGKPMPQYAGSSWYAGITEDAGGLDPLSFDPTNTVHSFTMAFSVRSAVTGTVASVRSGGSYATIEIRDTELVYRSTNGVEVSASVDADNGSWYQVALAHRYASQETLLYVNGALAGQVSERLLPDRFVLGGPDASGRVRAEGEIGLKEWFVYRAAWHGDEVQAHYTGALQQASLELYAPLNDVQFSQGGDATNLAQSLSSVSVNTTNVASRDGSSVTLTVVSDHGSPVPGTGAHVYTPGTVLTSSVSDAVSGGTQYVVTGWTLAGNDPAAGGSGSAVITLTNDAVLTWLWTTNYWLETLTNGLGSVSPAAGWQAAGSSLNVTATPAAGWFFGGWSGDGSGEVNPLAVSMNGSLALTALFIPVDPGSYEPVFTTYTMNGDTYMVDFGTNPVPDWVNWKDATGMEWPSGNMSPVSGSDWVDTNAPPLLPYTRFYRFLFIP